MVKLLGVESIDCLVLPPKLSENTDFLTSLLSTYCMYIIIISSIYLKQGGLDGLCVRWSHINFYVIWFSSLREPADCLYLKIEVATCSYIPIVAFCYIHM